MSARARTGRSLPGVVRLLLALGAGVALLVVVLGLLVGRKSGEIQALRSELATAGVQRQLMEGQLSAMQGTATALEARVSQLESADTARQLAELERAIELATNRDEVDELRATLALVQTSVDSFQAALDGLGARIDALASATTSAEPLPPEARLSVVPQRQEHSLSCESAAASMAARYHGVDLSEAEVISLLPRNENPNLGFRGNIDGPTGGIDDYGVYAGPIAAVLNSRGLHAWAVQGGLDGIRASIARGNPVIAWVTYHMAVSAPETVSIGGEEVALVPQQHVVVVTGYDGGGFWADDPWDGQEEYYAAAEFERAMGYFGNMALEVAAR